MLHLMTEYFEISRIIKLLVKYNVNASVTNRHVKLTGNISNKFLEELLDSVNIISISNFLQESSEICDGLEIVDKQSEMASEQPDSVGTIRREFSIIKPEQIEEVTVEEISVPAGKFILSKKTGENIESTYVSCNVKATAKSSISKMVEQINKKNDK